MRLTTAMQRGRRCSRCRLAEAKCLAARVGPGRSGRRASPPTMSSTSANRATCEGRVARPRAAPNESHAIDWPRIVARSGRGRARCGQEGESRRPPLRRRHLAEAKAKLEAARKALDTPSDTYTPLSPDLPEDQQRPADGARQVDHQPRQPADGPRRGQPHLGRALRPAAGGDDQQLRPQRQAAEPPRTARLARGRTDDEGLEDQAPAPAHRDQPGIPHVVDGARIRRIARSTPTTSSCGGSRSHRLEAEVVRDSLLAVAGELDLTTGGPEIPQDQGLDLAPAQPLLRPPRRGANGVPRNLRRRQPVRRLPPDDLRPAAAGPRAHQQRTGACGSAAYWRRSFRPANRTRRSCGPRSSRCWAGRRANRKRAASLTFLARQQASCSKRTRAELKAKRRRRQTGRPPTPPARPRKPRARAVQPHRLRDSAIEVLAPRVTRFAERVAYDRRHP